MEELYVAPSSSARPLCLLGAGPVATLATATRTPALDRMYSTKHPLTTTDALHPRRRRRRRDADAPNAALVPPPSFRARCRSAADHASCYVTLVAWLLLPFFFLGLYLYDPEASGTLAVPPPLVGATQGTTAALVSTRSCAGLRGRTPGGWRTTTSNVCSEVQVAGKQCATAKVWIAARKLCEKAGGRLCTSAEVRAGALAQSSCDVGERAVWSTRCGAGTNTSSSSAAGGRARASPTRRSRAAAGYPTVRTGPPAAGGVLRRQRLSLAE